MKIRENGVSPESEIYFHTPSDQARQLFFYPLCTGRFFCRRNYCVHRTSYDSFLALYVVQGRGYLEQSGERLPLKSGSFVLIDCYLPHHYGTDDEWDIYWLHFDGLLARRYFQLCAAGPIFHAEEASNAGRHLRKIFEAFHLHTRVSEAMLSRHIVDFITELILYRTPEQSNSRNSSMVDEIIGYMGEHVAEPLPIEQLASRVCVTPYHFIRLFKEETGLTPHQYLIRLRIDLAKYLLKTTHLPLKDIAERTGFCSASNLCTSFQRNIGITPHIYRLQKKEFIYDHD